MVYTVKERPTGALLVGLGFSSVERFAISASVRQANAFGSGKFVSANINSGSVNQVYALSYNDPYYTVDGVSQGSTCTSARPTPRASRSARTPPTRSAAG